jgi:hypothetical protein
MQPCLHNHMLHDPFKHLLLITNLGQEINCFSLLSKWIVALYNKFHTCVNQLADRLGYTRTKQLMDRLNNWLTAQVMNLLSDWLTAQVMNLPSDWLTAQVINLRSNWLTAQVMNLPTDWLTAQVMNLPTNWLTAQVMNLPTNWLTDWLTWQTAYRKPALGSHNWCCNIELQLFGLCSNWKKSCVLMLTPYQDRFSHFVSLLSRSHLVHGLTMQSAILIESLHIFLQPIRHQTNYMIYLLLKLARRFCSFLHVQFVVSVFT